MERFKDVIEKRDAAGLRALLTAHPDLRACDQTSPSFTREPAIVFCRRDRAMVDVLLDFGADINVRSQFWGRTVGVLDENTPQMRAYLIDRGALPEIDEFVEVVKAGDVADGSDAVATTADSRPHVDRPLFPFGAQAIVAAKDNREMVDTLLEFGADINARSDWWAGGFGVLDNTDPAQAAWLIERGAIVDIHAAAALGMIDKVKEWLASDPIARSRARGRRPAAAAFCQHQRDYRPAARARRGHQRPRYRSPIHRGPIQGPRPRAVPLSDRTRCGHRHLHGRGTWGPWTSSSVHWLTTPTPSRPALGSPGTLPVPPGHIYQWKLTGGPSVLTVAATDGGREIYDFLLSRSPLKEQFLAACQLADEAGAARVLAAKPNLLAELTPSERAQIVEAASSHNLPALTLMLNLGFDVNTRGGEGFTPVARAALRGDVEMVRVLIEHRADLEIRNDYGGTALDSCQWGSLNFRNRNGDYPACADALLKGGAKLYYPHFGSEAVQAVLQRYSESTDSSSR